MMTVEQDGNSLRYASDELQSDREVVMKAIKQNGNALQYASRELQNNRQIAIEAVKQDGTALTHASMALRHDRVVVTEAVKQNGIVLHQASLELQRDREVVKEAVKQHGYSLRWLPGDLQRDREIAMEAVKQDWEVVGHLSAELRGDWEFMMGAVASHPMALYFASNALRNGGLRTRVRLLKRTYTVPKHTFVATILFGAKGVCGTANGENGFGAPPLRRRRPCDNSDCVLTLLRPSSRFHGCLRTQTLRLICAYAGVRIGPRWQIIIAASRNCDDQHVRQLIESGFGLSISRPTSFQEMLMDVTMRGRV